MRDIHENITEAKYRSRIFTKTQVLFVQRQRQGWRRWAWWWWPPARWCPAPSRPRATCREDFEDQQSVGPSWKCGGSSLLGPTMERKRGDRVFLSTLLIFHTKNKTTFCQPWLLNLFHEILHSILLSCKLFSFSVLKIRRAQKKASYVSLSLYKMKSKMCFTDQPDHGAGLADDLHVVQPWGAKFNRDSKHLRTREDDPDVNCNRDSKQWKRNCKLWSRQTVMIKKHLCTREDDQNENCNGDSNGED